MKKIYLQYYVLQISNVLCNNERFNDKTFRIEDMVR